MQSHNVPDVIYSILFFPLVSSYQFGRKKKKFRGSLPPKPIAVEDTKKAADEEEEEESGDDGDLDAYKLQSDVSSKPGISQRTCPL